MTGVDRSVRAVYLVALVVLAGLGSLTVGPGVAGAANAVGGCTTITSSGSYELTGDLSGTGSGDACIRIEASDVHLEGNDNAIIAGQAAGEDSVGVYVTGSGLTNVTLANVTVDGYNNGTRFQGVADGSLEGVTLDIAFVGVRLDGSTVTGTDVTIDSAVTTDSGPTLDFEATDVVLYQPEAAPAPSGMAVAGQDQFSQVYVDSTTGQLGWSADVTIHYDPSGLDESTISMFRYDGSWLELSAASQDAGANTVSGSADLADARYAALGDTAQSTPTPTPTQTPTPTPTQQEPAGPTTTEDSAEVSFEETIIRGSRGDVLEIPLSMSNTDTATIAVGDAGVKYGAHVTVEDGDGDGAVDVRFNSYVPGSDVGQLVTATGADSVTDVTVEDSVASPLGSGEYPLSVGTGGEQTDVATLLLEERPSPTMTVRTAPGNLPSDLGGPGNVASLADDGSLATTATVTRDDYVVHEVEVTGVEGIVEAHRADGDSVTDGFLAARDDGALAFSIEETDASVDADTGPTEPAVDASTLTVVPDSNDDRLYLVYDLSAASGPATGEEFRSTFAVPGAAGTDGSDTATQRWSVAPIRISLDTNADLDGDGTVDDVLVFKRGDQTFTGSSTLAPGSEVDLSVRSSGGQTPFVLQRHADVGANGTFTATFSFPDVPNGTRFGVTILDNGRSYDGVVREQANASVTVSDALRRNRTAAVDAVELGFGGLVVVRDADGTVVGTKALSAGRHLNVPVDLDVDGSVQDAPFTFQLWRDTDGDGSFDPATDEAHTRGGAVVANDARLTIDTEPPTATIRPQENPIRGPLPQLVTLNGTRSADDVGIEDYEWSISLDGEDVSTGSGTLENFLARDWGNYTAELRVTDSVGRTDTGTATVEVIRPDARIAFPDQAVTVSDGSQVVTLETAFLPESMTVRLHRGDATGPQLGSTGVIDGNLTARVTLEEGLSAGDEVEMVAVLYQGLEGDQLFRDASGERVADSATVSVPDPRVEFADQELSVEDGSQTVTVDTVFVPNRGVVGVHLDNATGQLLGSTRLSGGTHTVTQGLEGNVSVGDSVEMVAVLYRGDDTEQLFRDASGDRVADSATVSTPEEETEGETGPGFTALATLVAVVLASLAAVRRQ